MKSIQIKSLFSLIALIAFFLSFILPGYRINNIPISPSAIVALIFVPFAFKFYSSRQFFIAIASLSFLFLLKILHLIIYDTDIRDILYLLIPITFIGAASLMSHLVNYYGIDSVQKWALWLCIFNIFVMLIQAFNIFDIKERLDSLWLSNIDFITDNETQRNILLQTISIRPPGMFPTGVFASTVTYIICRGIFIYQRKKWLLYVAFFAILITSNRTLAVIFITYEIIAFSKSFGVRKLLSNSFLLLTLISVSLLVLAKVSPDTYVIKFIFDELMTGNISSSDSIQERLKTIELFSNMSHYLILGGLSSSELSQIEHVFDSELMLRSLQFGIVGVICLSLIILLPRSGRYNSSWFFLIFIALVASLTTTLATSIVYVMAISFYKETVIQLKGGNQ